MPSPIARYSDLRDLRRSVTGLRPSRESFLAAIRGHSDSDDFADIESAGLELLRQVELAEEKLRGSLSVIKLRYAVLWARQSISDRSYERPHEGPLEQVLGETEKFLEKRLKEAPGTFAGLSEKSGVRTTVDSKMKLVELDVDPSRLHQAEYKASLIEAVNAGVTPAFESRNALHGALFAGTDSPAEETPSWLERQEQYRQIDAPLCLEAYNDLMAAKSELENTLPQIASAKDFDHLEDIAECVSDAEEGLALHISSLAGTRKLLETKSDLPRIYAADLDELEDVKRVFLVEGLTPAIFPRASSARQCVEAATAEIENQHAEEESRRSWQVMTRGVRQRVAEVELQTFEGHSQDDLVTASVTGAMQLVGLELRSNRDVEPQRIREDLIEAINGAFSGATRRRNSASMIFPG